MEEKDETTNPTATASNAGADAVAVPPPQDPQNDPIVATEAADGTAGITETAGNAAPADPPPGPPPTEEDLPSPRDEPRVTPESAPPEDAHASPPPHQQQEDKPLSNNNDDLRSPTPPPPEEEELDQFSPLLPRTAAASGAASLIISPVSSAESPPPNTSQQFAPRSSRGSRRSSHRPSVVLGDTIIYLDGGGDDDDDDVSNLNNLKPSRRTSSRRMSARPSLILGGNTVVFLDQDEDEPAPDDLKVRWNMRRTSDKPRSCCLQLCGVWLVLFLLLILLSATAGSIEFNLDVPFYNQDEINQQREDSWRAIERDADFVSTLGQPNDGDCIHEDPTILAKNGTLIQGPMPSKSCQRSATSFMRIMYVARDRKSNILTAENLRQIQEVENYILTKTFDLTRYCNLIDSTFPALETRDPRVWIEILSITAGQEPQYVACQRINSVLNFLDPLYFDRQNETGLGYYLVPNDQIPQRYNYSSLPDVIKYWSQFYVRSYDLSAYDFLVATVGETITLSNLFWRVTSSDFTLNSSTAIGLTSTYPLGVPINSYESASDSIEDQYSDIGQWLWDEFDSYLKGLSLDGIQVYWDDSEQGMSGAEEGYLATQSILFLPVSMFAVLLYLAYMQDSFFIGCMGMMQIVLSFIPTLLVYRYVVGEDYIGVLNMIALYIIMGIGVDNIFVFCDQFHHQRKEKDFARRMQKTFNVAGKAMLTTSCTTFVSFVANATSVFPAVRTFGLFAALLVLMNYLAVIIFFPAVYAVYYTRIRKVWWDHPTLLVCCKKEVAEEGHEHEEEEEEDDDKLVAFFRDKWAPFVIHRATAIFVMGLFFGVCVAAVVVTTRLQPDEDPPTTLPEGNNYLEYPEVLLEFFARSGNPRAIDVIWVSGIDPDDPIDRSGTDDTNVTDYGVANYLDCSTYNPTTAAAQVWSLQTCHDLFFGNVTDYHGSSNAFGPDGANGPRSRLMVTENVRMDEFSYYSVVSCPMQGMRDWLLTDTGCAAIQKLGLPCMNETSQRPGCSQWDINGNSCEPFPVPEESFLLVLVAFLQDGTPDPATQLSNFDQYSEQVLVAEGVEFDEDTIVKADFSCRTDPEGDDDLVLFALATIATLDQDFAQNYEDGITLYEKWDAWSKQMRENAPREMIGTMQTSTGAWGFYFLNETLLSETFTGIALALGLSFLILTVIQGNIIMAFLAVGTIILIVLDVLAFTRLAGWSLGVIEAVNYVVVIGMSIDYAVHMSEAYTTAGADTRAERVILMMEEMGVSVLSGALSTLIAAFFMFFAPNAFFVKFATFLFVTIALSCLYSMTFFPAMLSLIGPLGQSGEIYVCLARWRLEFMHNFAKSYVLSQQFLDREKERNGGKSVGIVQLESVEFDEEDEGDSGTPPTNNTAAFPNSSSIVSPRGGPFSSDEFTVYSA